jgi:murein L,D-transpeptidase YafK
LGGLSVRGAQALYWRPLLWSHLACAAIAAAVLAGCNLDKIRNISGRHMQPLSEEMLAELDTKSMAKESPILIRIFKQESELELWKVDKSGRFALLRTYPTCRWSGDLGPKVQEGDRQAPEGFYTITPELMNPKSNYHLAINTGFPNAYDRANGRSGTFLMIHGNCASVGCYAMTDEQIAEIYSLARESFFGGQRSFQVQAYPFRMTPLNMARHCSSPHLAFWKELKRGYDHFEATRKEPKVAVCEKHYVFDAQSSGKFNPVGRCPAYEVPQQIASAVDDKQHRDQVEITRIVRRGIPAAPTTTVREGDMNPTFLSALSSHDGPATAIRTAAGTIPAQVRPPSASFPGAGASGFGIPAPEVKPVQVRVDAAAPSSSSIGAFFGKLFDFKPDDTSPDVRESSVTPSVQARSQATADATGAVPAQGEATATIEGAPEAQRNTESKKVATTTEPPPDEGGAHTTNLLIGALPALPAESFQNGFDACIESGD